MIHLTYLEAGVVGLIQGISEMFPVSSLGHNVLLPAIVGGSWARDLDVSSPESPYLAFIVGLHVATAAALLIYFRRDWIRLIGGFCTSIRDRQVVTADQRGNQNVVAQAGHREELGNALDQADHHRLGVGHQVRHGSLSLGRATTTRL